jgi:uncharacterized membrane protein YhiD involved in acid resistance
MDELFSGSQLGNVGPIGVLTNLLLSLVLAVCTSVVYRKTHTGYAYSRAFNLTMVIVAMVITMTMMVIGNYLALSLGLVGALSVIRFRSAIKDPRDIAYLFLCIAIGLACSTGDYVIAVLGAFVINLTILMLSLLRFGASASSDYCLTFSVMGKEAKPEEFTTRANELFSKVQFRSYCQLSDDVGEYVYSVMLSSVSEEAVIGQLTKQVPGIQNLSLIAPETNLEV